MEPKYKLGDAIECENAVGWVVAIYALHESKPKAEHTWLYAIEEPESEAIDYFTEKDLEQ